MDELTTVVNRIESEIAQCLEWLGDMLKVSEVTIGTHRLLTIAGVDRSPECLRALAVYCVGQIVNAVEVNLEIRADLLGLDNQRTCERLVRDVYSVIGDNNESLTDEQKEDERDPWLFEALSHLLVHLSTRNSRHLPVGRLIGLMPLHKSAKEAGLDLIAAYAAGHVGLGLGESKAWANDPSGGLRAAAAKFRDVDQGGYDSDLRIAVGLMRYALPMEYRSHMTDAFWEEERAYLPFIGYDSNQNPQWTSEREALRSLGVPSSHRILVPLPIKDFRVFFDDLANEMRAYLELLGEQLLCMTLSPEA